MISVSLVEVIGVFKRVFMIPVPLVEVIGVFRVFSLFYVSNGSYWGFQECCNDSKALVQVLVVFKCLNDSGDSLKR
ncbi:hypothetical protein E2C01_070376 [Portunus trituberculatus]|uniref:Uncharacterized protein n=1 Tax=Portunus trituberculatus TaxID=210409 RepID=A0A5B7I1F1_PORTR|nr:hypothetical protein [Portunus trituberculatus]